MLNAGEFADLANQFKKEYYTKPEQQGALYSPEQVAAFKNGQAGFNYIDHIFNEPALAQNYDLSISGKNGKTSYLASLRYENTEGIIKESVYKQYNWRLKLDTEIKKWVNVGLNLWGDYSETAGPRMTQYNGLLLSAINYAPTVEPKMTKVNTTINSPLMVTPHTIRWDILTILIRLTNVSTTISKDM